MAAKFAILRRESAGGYSTRGPTAHEMTFDEARTEIARLKSHYPYQDFVIMGEIGEARRSERVTVKIEAPSLPTVAKRRRKLPKLEGNVVALQTPPRENTG